MSAIKKHPVPIILAACAVIAVLSLLWYTRPRSWGNIIFYNGELTQFSAVANTYEFNGDTPGFITYMLKEEDGLEAPGEQILDSLEAATYRVRPWDTLKYSHGGSYGESGSGSMTIYLMWDQAQQAEYLILYSSGTVCKGDTIYTVKDGVNLYKNISAVIQEHGAKSD